MSCEAHDNGYCPAMRSLNHYTDKAHQEKGGRGVMQRASAKISRVALNRTIKKTDCQETVASVPATPDPMPEIGTDEYIAFTEACPAFERYIGETAKEFGLDDETN